MAKRKGLSHLGITKQKNRRGYCFYTVSSSVRYYNLFSNAENLWFSLILIIVFLFYRRFLPLDVPMYAFGAENDDFCSKSVRPPVLFSLRIHL